jgi:hypothetical protein
MKKLIAIATLFFAFTISASAQDKSNGFSSEKAKNEMMTLNAKLNLSDDLKRDVYTLLAMRNEELQNKPQMTAAEKEKMNKKVENKIMSALTEAQKATVNSDPDLKKLITN